MPLREHRVGGRPFAAIGASLDSKSWESRLQAILSELLTDVPCLRELKASVFELRFESTLTGVDLNVFLLESPQRQLPSLTEDGENDDLFIQDVERAVRSQQGIEDRITLAIGPGLNPMGQPDVVEIRQRLKMPRGQRSVTLWTSPKATTLPLFDLPRFLPLAGQQSVLVRVTKLTTLWADVTLCEDLHLAPPFFIQRGATIVLKRCGDHQQPETGVRLAYAMDTKNPLAIVVAVVLEWNTGEPNCLELLDFIDATDA